MWVQVPSSAPKLSSRKVTELFFILIKRDLNPKRVRSVKKTVRWHSNRRDMMHKDYLESHKKVLFNSLLMQGKLYQHCFEVGNQARDMFDTLVERMKKVEGITEGLKEHDQWEWVRRTGNIHQRANEIVCYEIIYCKYQHNHRY